MLWLSIFAMLSLSVQAEPARNRVLDDVGVRHGPGHAVVEIRLSVPFQYLSHFPQQEGRELHIRIQPQLVPATERAAMSGREAMRPPAAEFAALREVAYEGDHEDTPYLVLEFEQPVSFEVFPGADYRSISVVVITQPPC